MEHKVIIGYGHNKALTLYEEVYEALEKTKYGG